MLEVLLVDDDPVVRITVAHALSEAGHHASEAADGEEALAIAGERAFDVAVCDVRMPKLDGLAVFRHLRRESPRTAVILMTAYATVPEAVAALREGAYDYVLKPFDPEELVVRVIGGIAERLALRAELERARAELASRDIGALIVGHSPAIERVRERLDAIAQSEAPVLVCGEPGTGRELAARTLHGRSGRRAMPFVSIHCGEFPELLLDAELFGGVNLSGNTHVGRIQAANRGSLLIEEISEMPLVSQAKLVRAMNEHVVEPAGTDTRAPIDARVIATTSRALAPLVESGRFRADLRDALGVLDVSIPPLRERRADLPLLVAEFLKRHTAAGTVPPGIALRAWTALADYPFPGNVDELGRAIERAVALAHGSEIDLEHLPSDIASGHEQPLPTPQPGLSPR